MNPVISSTYRTPVENESVRASSREGMELLDEGTHAWWSARGRPSIPCPSEVTPALGRMSDRDAAQLAGVSDGTVRRWRREANIPPYCAKKSHPGCPGRRLLAAKPGEPVRSAEEILADTPPLLRARAREDG